MSTRMWSSKNTFSPSICITKRNKTPKSTLVNLTPPPPSFNDQSKQDNTLVPEHHNAITSSTLDTTIILSQESTNDLSTFLDVPQPQQEEKADPSEPPSMNAYEPIMHAPSTMAKEMSRHFGNYEVSILKNSKHLICHYVAYNNFSLWHVFLVDHHTKPWPNHLLPSHKRKDLDRCYEFWISLSWIQQHLVHYSVASWEEANRV